MTNRWDAAQYDAKHALVHEKAKGLLAPLAPQANGSVAHWAKAFRLMPNSRMLFTRMALDAMLISAGFGSLSLSSIPLGG